MTRDSGELGWIMTGIGAVCVLGCASAVFPWLELLVGQVLAALAAAALLAAAIWWVQRRAWEYREDRADIAHVNAVLTARARTEHERAHSLPIGGER